MIQNTHHICIYCFDVDESVKFYTEILGFHSVCRCKAMEGDRPLILHYVKRGDIVIELAEQTDKSKLHLVAELPCHIALRTDDADALYAHLQAKGVQLECEPFTAPLGFDRPLTAADDAVFTCHDEAGAQARIFFFRGPAGERFEVMADNIGGLA